MNRADGERPHPGQPSAWIEKILRRVWAPLVQLTHRPSMDGVENLPASGPFLLVSNHSAGLGLAELSTIAVLYVTKVGTHRKLAGFAHPAGFTVWPLSALLRELGAVPSTYAAAEATLAQGIPLLIFPGGDHETLRPIWQANLVDFGGRVGFLRIARKAGVSIVPMGISGSHYTAPILLRSRLLAYLLVVPRLAWSGKRWAISLLGAVGAAGLMFLPVSLPIRLALAFLWLGSPLTMMPFVPWTIRIRIGKPIPPDALFGTAQDETDLRPALARVESEIQSLVAGR